MFPKAYADRAAKFRVPGGFVLIAAFLWWSTPTCATLAWGVPVALAGLALRGWAAGHLEKNRELSTSGPYAYVRNPLYIGTLTVAAGFAIASRRWELAALFAVVFLFVYLPVVELEEQHLRSIFPAYAEYERSVPKLVPRFTAAGSPKHFRWTVYRRNEEYQAAIGFAVALLVLVAKKFSHV